MRFHVSSRAQQLSSIQPGAVKQERRSDIETIDIADVNDAYERVVESDVRYRFVIDIATLAK